MSTHSLEIRHRAPCVQTCAMGLSYRFCLRFSVAAIAPLRVVYVFSCQSASIFRAFLDMLTDLSDMAVQLDNCPECPHMGSVHTNRDLLSLRDSLDS